MKHLFDFSNNNYDETKTIDNIVGILQSFWEIIETKKKIWIRISINRDEEKNWLNSVLVLNIIIKVKENEV